MEHRDLDPCRHPVANQAPGAGAVLRNHRNCFLVPEEPLSWNGVGLAAAVVVFVVTAAAVVVEIDADVDVVDAIVAAVGANAVVVDEEFVEESC